MFALRRGAMSNIVWVFAVCAGLACCNPFGGLTRIPVGSLEECAALVRQFSAAQREGIPNVAQCEAQPRP